MAVLPTTNITTTLVANTLGENSHNIGQLCRSSRINPWSKRKPVKFANDITDPYPEWWKGDDGYCGFNIGEIILLNSNVETVMQKMDAGAQKWTYVPPDGTYRAPFRLGDFRKYMHDAPKGVEADAPSEIATASYTFSVKFNKSGGDMLALSDIGKSLPFGNMYLGVLAKNTSNGTYRWLTSTTMVKDGDMSVTLPFTGLVQGTYKAYFFLASKQRISITDAVVAMDYALLPVDVLTFKLRTDGGLDITIVAERLTLGNIKVEINIANNSGGVINMSGCWLYVKYGDNDILSALEAGEISANLGDVSIPNGSSHKFTKNYLDALRDFPTRRGHVFFKVNSPSITKEQEIITPRN